MGSVTPWAIKTAAKGSASLKRLKNTAVDDYKSWHLLIDDDADNDSKFL